MTERYLEGFEPGQTFGSGRIHIDASNGDQLAEITTLVESGIIRPVVDRVFPFDSTDEALAYVEAGRARGKVVVQVRPPEARRAV